MRESQRPLPPPSPLEEMEDRLKRIESRLSRLDGVLGQIFRTPRCQDCREEEADRELRRQIEEADRDAWSRIDHPPALSGFYLVYRELENDGYSPVCPLFYDDDRAGKQRADPALASENPWHFGWVMDFGEKGMAPELRNITHWRPLPPEP